MAFWAQPHSHLSIIGKISIVRQAQVGWKWKSAPKFG
jgi:hypothetical protein